MDMRASRQEAIPTHNRTFQDSFRMEEEVAHRGLVALHKALDLDLDLMRHSSRPLVSQQVLVVFMVGYSQPHHHLHRPLPLHHSNRIPLEVFMEAITKPCTIFSQEVKNYVFFSLVIPCYFIIIIFCSRNFFYS
jgi:hypothetical protein